MTDAEKLEGALLAYRYATEAVQVLLDGMGGHSHWDWTMSHGAGCETCIQQREARNRARMLLAMANQASKWGGPF